VKVLLVNDYGTETGGTERVVITLRDALRRLGHEVRFFSSTARPLAARTVADYTCLGTTSRWRTLLQTANPWAVRALRAALAEFRPDLVDVRLFLTQLSPSILPLLRDVPSLLLLDSYRSICPTGTKLLPDGSVCGERAGWVCHRAGCLPARDWAALSLQMATWRRRLSVFDRILACSEWVQARLAREGIPVEGVVPNGVPSADAHPPAGTEPVVCFAGRLVREKGADVLLEATASLVGEFPGLRLLVAGDGPERRALVRRCDALALSKTVDFLGHLDPAERERRFAGAWVQVVPSRWEEPFGLVAAEAMLRGTAVVASDAGGLSEVLDFGRSGVLVPPSDPKALADGVRALLRSRARCEALGASGRERALEHYGAERQADRMSEIYASLVG